MRSALLTASGYAPLLLLPSAMALNTERSNHVAELRVVPNNLTLMTPRDTNSIFERQVFDFGSPYSTGFSGLRRLGARQGCNAGFDQCQNDPTTCCQLGGDCCGGGICCKAGTFCYGGGCCVSTKVGCDNKGCCDPDADCCSGGGCCASGSRCVTINGKQGCCPTGQTCITEPQCNRTGYSPCPNETFCCPTGDVCSRDSAGNPLCSPNAQTSATALPSSTQRSSAGASLSSHLSTKPQADPTGVSSRTLPVPTAQPSGSGVVFSPQSPSTTNIGAIAGGTVTGVVVLVAMLTFLIMWRRKQSGSAKSEKPAGADLGTGPPYDHAYNPNPVAPTPGTVDPFLTPMAQNPGVSYFSGGSDRPVSGAGSASHYSGLPEPQHGDESGPAVGASPMPVPRHDIHHPYPVPMSVTPLRKPAADPGPVRVWSGFGSRPPGGQTAAYGGSNSPYPGPSGWSHHETTSTSPGPAYSNPPDARNTFDSTPPPRAPSTLYQPSSEGGEHHANDNQSLYPPPPGSPPPESLYPRTFAGNFSSLPGGAAPPVTNFAPAEKAVYRVNDV